MKNNLAEIFYVRYKRCSILQQATLCFRSIRNILPTIRTPTNHRANQPLKTRSKHRMWWEENQLGRLLYTRCSRWLSKTSVLTSKGGADGGDISGALRAVASIASVSIVKAVIVPAHPGYMRARVHANAHAPASFLDRRMHTARFFAREIWSLQSVTAVYIHAHSCPARPFHPAQTITTIICLLI